MIVLPVWSIPLAITLICVFLMTRPSKGSFYGPNFDGIYALILMMPILLAWMLYFAWLAWRHSP